MSKELAKPTPASMVKANIDEMVKSLPGGKAAIQRFKQAALGVAMSPGIVGCTPRSVVKCVYACARLNLIPDPVRHLVAIVPFRNKGNLEATLIIEYRGIVTLAKRADPGIAISASTVYENDDYQLIEGTDNSLVITKRWWEKGLNTPGKVLFFYCVAKQKDGAPTLTVIPEQEARQVGHNSKAGDGPGSIWNKHFERMGEKTALKRDSRFWHLDPDKEETLQFREALVYDDNEADEIPYVSVEDEVPALAEGDGTKRSRKVRPAKAETAEHKSTQPDETKPPESLLPEDDGDQPATPDDIKRLNMVAELKLDDAGVDSTEENRAIVIVDATEDMAFDFDEKATRDQTAELVKVIRGTRKETIIKLFAK